MLVCIAIQPAVGYAQKEPEPRPAVHDVAGQPSARVRAQARQKEALELYKRFKFKDALSALRAARALSAEPLQLYNMGLVQRELKDYVGAVTALHAYIEEETAPDEARLEMTRALLLELEPLVVRLRLQVPSDRVEVTLDDEPLPTQAGIQQVWTVPGRHHIRATGPGRIPFDYEADLAPGDVDTIRIHLPPAPASQGPARPSRAQPEVTTVRPALHADSGRETRLWLGWTATAALAISATVVGVVALREDDELRTLKRDRDAEWDQEAADRLYDRKTRHALVADILWPAAIVAGALSLWWTFDVDRPGEDAPAPPVARVRLGPGQVALRGTF